MILPALCGISAMAQDAWIRHTIDDSSRGADGVRLGDADQDGRLDIVTGWEEGGRIRICFQPDVRNIKRNWPSIEVGAVKSPEDAVFADINGDGWLDVVSCCEGREQSINFHMNPGDKYVREEHRWKTVTVTASRGVTRWMFCQPMNDGTLIVGSKQPNAQIMQFDPDKAGKATFQTLRKSGWIMSLRKLDVDGDGDEDIIYSDRKGAFRGVGWLENHGNRNWSDHVIGGTEMEVMFLDVVPGRSPASTAVRQSDVIEIYCDTRNKQVLWFQPGTDIRKPWKSRSIPHPEAVGGGKAVAAGDINGDGHIDLACTCEHAEGRVGVYWLAGPFRTSANLQKDSGPTSVNWHSISGSRAGVKYDRIELLDIDQDGDLDLLTCEERDNLGVIWYENPLRIEKNPPGDEENGD